MITDYVNYSGGAKGSDFFWQSIGIENGFINHKQYWYGKMNPFSKKEDEISLEEYKEGILEVRKANKILKRNGINKYMPLLSRTWTAIKQCDGIYAIGSFQDTNIVSGGTTWGIVMGINHLKQIYFYEQNHQQWYYYNHFIESFEDCDDCDVILTQKYAGIGTRKINQKGIEAIHTVYQNTLKYI
jgi:hypothetical protein